jgi:hypothetical protein
MTCPTYPPAELDFHDRGLHGTWPRLQGLTVAITRTRTISDTSVVAVSGTKCKESFAENHTADGTYVVAAFSAKVSEHVVVNGYNWFARCSYPNNLPKYIARSRILGNRDLMLREPLT